MSKSNIPGKIISYFSPSEDKIKRGDFKKICEAIRETRNKVKIFDIFEEYKHNFSQNNFFKFLFENLDENKDILIWSIQYYYHNSKIIGGLKGFPLFFDRSGEIVEIMKKNESISQPDSNNSFCDIMESVLSDENLEYTFLTGSRIGEIEINSGDNKIPIPGELENSEKPTYTQWEITKTATAILIILGLISYSTNDRFKNKIRGLKEAVSGVINPPNPPSEKKKLIWFSDMK